MIEINQKMLKLPFSLFFIIVVNVDEHKNHHQARLLSKTHQINNRNLMSREHFRFFLFPFSLMISSSMDF